MLAQNIPQSSMVESVAMDGKVALRVDSAKHAAIAVQVVWRIAIEEITFAFRYRVLERAAIHARPVATEPANLINHPCRSVLVFIDCGHPAKKSGAIGQVAIEPVVSR